MQLDIQDFLTDSGTTEPLYPGKRLVRRLPQSRENTSHCVIYDWRNPDTLRLDVKAGLHGKELLKKDLVKYPVSFQVPTFVEIDTSANVQEEEKDEDGEGEQGSRGEGSGGGPRLSRKMDKIFSAFASSVEGKIPALGEIKKMVVMGKTIAKEAFEPVFNALVAQLRNLSIVPVNLLAAGNAAKLTIATPGGRAISDLPAELVERADVKYKPKDMFGVPS